MTRKEARKAAEVMLAYADGKEIELYDSFNKEWNNCPCPNFDWGMSTDLAYRIKPTPTYRPFANAEECWEEMKKHEPFGWLKDKEDGHYVSIHSVDERGFFSTADEGWYYSGIMRCFTFADGSVFGKLTEE